MNRNESRRDACGTSWLFRSPAAVMCVSVALLSGILALAPEETKAGRSTDYQKYYAPVAHNLLSGRGLVTSSGRLAIRYPPGHSLFLAGLFGAAERLGASSESLFIAASTILQAASATLLFVCVTRIAAPGAAWLAAVLWCVYPPAIWSSMLMNSETPFVPVFLGAVLVCWISRDGRPAWGGICGILSGLSMLIRPIAVGIPLIFGLFLLFGSRIASRRQRTATAGLVLAGSLLTVLPWQLKMYEATGEFHLLSSGGMPSIIDGLSFGRPSPSRRALDLSPAVKNLGREALEAYNAGHITTTSDLARWLLKCAGERPAAIAELILLKAARSWYGTDSHRHEYLIAAIQLPLLIAFALGSGVALRKGGGTRDFAILCLALVAYYWMMTVVVLSVVRYIVPVMPLVIAVGMLAWAPLVEQMWTHVVEFCRFKSHRASADGSNHPS